ncbi:MAG: hypothetical protein ACI9WU_004914 [Myxococcota bacterium]
MSQQRWHRGLRDDEDEFVSRVEYVREGAGIPDAEGGVALPNATPKLIGGPLLTRVSTTVDTPDSLLAADITYQYVECTGDVPCPGDSPVRLQFQTIAGAYPLEFFYDDGLLNGIEVHGKPEATVVLTRDATCTVEDFRRSASHRQHLDELLERIGLRDRAILEVFYSTGIRRQVMCRLAVVEIDFERHTLFVREGKGRKDRMIPIGERALAWVLKYLDGVRPQLVLGDDDGTLFLTENGESITPNRMTQLVRDHVASAEIGKTGSCHVFRHTMATLMLEGGADIRFIQQMLGHGG